VLVALAALLLSVPDTPALRVPSPDGGWARSSYFPFIVSAYNDPAGVPQRSLSVEYRREDGGFDAGESRMGTSDYLQTPRSFGPEGSTWFWRARYTNTLDQSSPWSAEAPFRVDDTAPTLPTSIDAGLVNAMGCTVEVDFTPGTDALSGIVEHALIVGPSPLGPWYDYVPTRPGPPLVETLGEGTWFMWVDSADRADNRSGRRGTGPMATIAITPDPALPVLPPPFWHNEPFGKYGEIAEWSIASALDAGYTQIVLSFCNVDAGCVWSPAPPARPANATGSWIQAADEAFFRARIAGVRGDRVSPWSAPSNTIVLDRTGPSCDAPTAVAVDAGLVRITWSPCVEPLTAVATQQLEERRVGSGSGLVPVIGTSTLRQPGPGAWAWRLRATDTFGNTGDFGPYSNTVMLAPAGDGGGEPPDAGSEPSDAGAEPPDAGPSTDGGTQSSDAGTGSPEPGAFDIRCGCGSGGPFLLLLLLTLRRRRRLHHE